ncbi:MAG: branched-chain amino acid ABC transporter permease [Alphaproteobacteria bacterium]|nr:branched-chain amino acid ABC transporter permease [Alphaproteobacteria bacterium]
MRELRVALVFAAAAAAGYFLFPDNLALLTQVVGIGFLVLSLDLVTGYCGVATLGHAALFGIAAYAVGAACARGLTDPIALLAVGMMAGSVAGLMSGALITRFQGLPQLVLSIAIGQLVEALAKKLQFLTGGSDGLSDFVPGRLFGIFAFDIYDRTAFLLSVGVFVITFVLLRRLADSPFGLMCRGIRDDPLRARMIGAAIWPRLVVMYGIAGAVAGLGGALSAMSTRVVGLDSVGFALSGEALVMLVFGGSGRLWGAVLGTVIFMWFKQLVAAHDPYNWILLVGILLILTVVFAPRGLSGLILSLRGFLARAGK